MEFLTGHWRDEHLHTLASALQLHEAVQGQIAATTARLQAEVRALQPEDCRDTPVPPHPNPTKEKALRRRGDSDTRTELYRWAGVDLTRIDGIGAGAAEVILTEVGLDLSAFPSEKHFASWLRLVPRTALSGGKPLRHKKTPGSGSLGLPASCAWRLSRCSAPRPRSALPFGALPATRGGAVAIFAIARKLAILVYRMLRYGEDYVDLGEAQYEAPVPPTPPRRAAPHGGGPGLYTDPGHRHRLSRWLFQVSPRICRTTRREPRIVNDELDYAYDEMIDSLYSDFAADVLAAHDGLYGDVVEQFAQERLQSYYVQNPDVALPACWALEQARALLPDHPEASLVFAVTAAEVGLKSGLLKPILHGLVHDEAFAAIIANLMPTQRNQQFRDLLFAILGNYGSVDLGTFVRPGASPTLWDEMQQSSAAPKSCCSSCPASAR